MAKEMMIILVYDTQMVQKEEDDPVSAILYFHPHWVSDQQKTALSGQLMGTVHCIKSVFAPPKIVSLQSGKFYIKEFGRYIMAVGTDRNISDWLLEHRANVLTSLIRFFHQDIETMSKGCDSNDKLSAKLYHLFETYLKYLFLGGNIFSYTPSIKLPKSASNVFLEAIHILQSCQELNSVLGGSITYHNKIVATQLSSDVTKKLILTDPFRIKCPAEVPNVGFDLPLGVQLLQIYITNEEFFKLNEEANKCRNMFQYLNKSIKKNQTKSNKEPIISQMKRDQSLIFTSVPEEGIDQITTRNVSQPKSRPKFLNLKATTTDDIKPAQTTVPTTPYLGQTTVCSTPMGEFKKIVHQNVLSICLDPAIVENNCSPKESPKNNNNNNNNETELRNMDKIAPYLFINKNYYDNKRYSSTFDLREKLKCINKSVTMKYYNLDTTEKYKTLEESPDNENNNNNHLKTITDPNYPIFKLDGTLISFNYYTDFLEDHLKNVTMEIREKKSEKNPFKDFDSFELNVVRENNKKPVITSQQSESAPVKMNREHRKSLTLPLKPLNADSSIESIVGRKNSVGVQLTPLMSKLTFDERSSGFCSREATPLYTPTQTGFPFNYKKIMGKLNKKQDKSLQKCFLFVCGQQDMVMSLLLQEEINEKLIRDLWEICTDNLGRLEKQLQHCLEAYSGSSQQSDGEPYSYLLFDSDWDTVQRGGPWGSSELGALTYFHRDFKNYPNITEIILRCCDGVIYGYQCANHEVFYHQTATTNAGLPTPADLMGTAPLKAKRRLERDHNIILL